MHLKVRKLSGLDDGCIHIKSNEHGNCLKTKSRVVAQEFFQIQDVVYHETMFPTPVSAPIKI